jgi:hypothetical protein
MEYDSVASQKTRMLIEKQTVIDYAHVVSLGSEDSIVIHLCHILEKKRKRKSLHIVLRL